MKKLIVLAALFSLVTAPGPVQAADDLAHAEQLTNAGKNAQAIQILDGYLSAHPKDPRALVDRGDAYQNEGRLRESIADYTSALSLDPKSAYIYASRAQSYEQLDNDQQALDDANKALALKPNFAYALRTRGLARLHLNDLAGAQADFHAAIAADPSSAYSYAFACRADRTAKQLDTARKECDEALKIDPTNYPAMFQRGRLQLDTSDWSDAEATFSAILALHDNDDVGSNYWRAFARLQLKQGDGALADINTYLRKYPGDSEGLYMRAQIDQLRGDAAAAKSDASAALTHYQADKDNDGAAKAQALLDQLAHPS
jgi:tetratricopeptide (TPR) repeat protein